MRFKHCIEEIKEGFYYFEDVLKATAHSSLNTEVVKEIWNGFCHTASDLEVGLSNETSQERIDGIMRRTKIGRCVNFVFENKIFGEIKGTPCATV